MLPEQTIEFRYDTQLFIEGEDLDEDKIYDIVVEDMDRHTRGLQG